MSKERHKNWSRASRMQSSNPMQNVLCIQPSFVWLLWGLTSGVLSLGPGPNHQKRCNENGSKAAACNEDHEKASIWSGCTTRKRWSMKFLLEVADVTAVQQVISRSTFLRANKQIITPTHQSDARGSGSYLRADYMLYLLDDLPLRCHPRNWRRVPTAISFIGLFPSLCLMAFLAVWHGLHNTPLTLCFRAGIGDMPKSSEIPTVSELCPCPDMTSHYNAGSKTMFLPTLQYSSSHKN